ncbi:MAG: CHAD domain-containing protein [Brevinematales bacterium]|jgi:CHAD domain-containing protein
MIEKEFKWITGKGFEIDSLLKKLSERPGKKIEIASSGIRDYRDRYYDTGDLCLFKAGFGCRLRVSDDLKIEVKFQPKKTSGKYMTRPEWLIDRKDRKDGGSYRFEDKKVREFFLEEFGFIIPGDMIPVVEINDSRTKWEIKYRGDVFELTLDRAQSSPLIAGLDGPYDFRELELEAIKQSGPHDRAFLELGALINDVAGLKRSEKNKLERSLSGLGMNTRKVPRFRIKGDEETSLTVKKIFGYYLKVTSNNIYGAQIGNDNEYIHEIRVALRKLRTALQFFQYTLSAENFNYLKNNLKWITLALGKVRDIDVFSSKLKDYVPREILENNPELRDGIRDEVNSLRNERRSEMLGVLHSYRFRHFMEKTALLIESGFQRRDNNSISKISTKQTARDILLGSAGDTVKAAVSFLKNREKATDASIHKLRIRFKRLRYSIEFFEDLLTADEKKFYRLIPPIQEVLGAYVDTFFISELCSEILGKIPLQHKSVLGLSFILNGISATMESWKAEQRSKLFEIVRNFADSSELADFLEDIKGLMIRQTA